MENSKKQTAVEWLESQLLELFEDHLPFELLEQAKELEKQQIIDANWEASEDTERAEQYYNETFNK